MPRMGLRRVVWTDRTRVLLLWLVAVLMAASAGALAASPAHAATFTVNRTGDAGDRNIADAACDTSRKRGKQCTLRAAIEEANDISGASTIGFAIGGTAPVKTISPASPLPAIIREVTIDGYSQRGARANTKVRGNDAVLKVQLDGSNAGADADGFLIQTSDVTIKGLVINRFASDGIQINGFVAIGNSIEGNFIGINAAGTEARPNADDGVQNRVEGNFIGTRADGTGDLGANGGGVLIGNAPNNIIGGVDADDGAVDGVIKATNVISGHRFAGVLISGAGATGNRVLSNSISSNGDLGIDLNVATDPTDDVTANDLDDPDTGPNNLQNFPRLGSATKVGSNVTVSGTLNSIPSQSFTIQCFLAASDPSGHGEGRSLLAQTTATTNAGGDASFTCAGTVGFLAPGQTVTATATNTTTGDTSEFSQNVRVS